MPYPGLDDNQTEKMDRCVQEVMAQGNDKETAIAICMKSIKGEDDGDPHSEQFDAVEFSIAPVSDTEYDALRNMTAGKLPDRGDILAFKNSRLAKAERNANGDVLNDDNIRELGDTLAFKPLLSSHGPQARIVGMYTAGRPSRMVDGTYLIADGILWATRAKDVVLDVLTGKAKQSIEAASDRVGCTACGRDFQNTTYCEHLAPILNGQALAPNVGRKHYNMRATGGALVRNPAGTNAGFSDSVFMMASQMEKNMDESEVMIEESAVTNAAASDEPIADNSTSELDELRAELASAKSALGVAAENYAVGTQRAVVLMQAGFASDKVLALLPKLPSMDSEVFDVLVATRAETVAAGAKPRVATDTTDAPPISGSAQPVSWSQLFK